MTEGVVDKIKDRLAFKPKPHIETSEHYLPPEKPKERTIVKDERKQRVPPEETLVEFRRDINRAVTSGQLDLVNDYDDQRRYVAMCEEYVNAMEPLDPDNKFRADLVFAQTKNDYVEEGRALLRACDRLQSRRGVAFTPKSNISQYQPDEGKTFGRYYGDKEEDSDGHS